MNLNSSYKHVRVGWKFKHKLNLYLVNELGHFLEMKNIISSTHKSSLSICQISHTLVNICSQTLPRMERNINRRATVSAHHYSPGAQSHFSGYSYSSFPRIIRKSTDLILLERSEFCNICPCRAESLRCGRNPLVSLRYIRTIGFLWRCLFSSVLDPSELIPKSAW